MKKTIEEINKLAIKHHLELDTKSINCNESGLDFWVAFANDVKGQPWVLRLPRRVDVIQSSATEKKVLDFLLHRFPIPVPQWKVFSDDLIAYPSMEGIPVGTINLKLKAYEWKLDEKNLPEEFIHSMAVGLKNLHQLSGIELDFLGDKVIKARDLKKHMHKRMKWANDKFSIYKALWNRWQNWLESDSYWPETTGLIHGDLHPGHIFIDSSYQVCGIIDWTEAMVSDVSKDFIAFYQCFGENALQRLIQEYEKSGAYVWPKMYDHILELNSTVAIDIAEFANRSGLDEYWQYAKNLLENEASSTSEQ